MNSPTPLLEEVQRAVIEGEQLDLWYVAGDGRESSRRVHPLGLAATVADTADGLRTFRGDRVRSVVTTGERVVRPDGFELGEAWKLIADRVDALSVLVTARALIEPGMVSVARLIMGSRVGVGGAVADGRIELELRGHSERSLAGEIAGIGGALEVVKPEGVRTALAAVGAELVARYSER